MSGDNKGGAIGCWLVIVFKACAVVVVLGFNLLSCIGPSCSGFRFLGVTIIIIGIAIIIISILFGCLAFNDDSSTKVGACCIMPLLLVLVALGIFAIAVSSKGGSRYHVESYSKWMQNKVQDIHNWENYYKEAVVHKHVCSKSDADYNKDPKDAEYNKRKFSYYVSDCCKPPQDCNFTFISPTIWKKPEIGNYSNVDCHRWDNYPLTLCFDCQSCKAALLRDVRDQWLFIGIVLIVIAGIVLSLGIFCASLTDD